MILGYIIGGLFAMLFIAVAFSVALLWVKIVCWVVAAVIVGFLFFCWLIDNQWNMGP